LLRAIAHLARRGASVMILGCTELPLILEQSPDYPVDGGTVALLDPTDILARRCVEMAGGGVIKCR
jgi:aspartate racemase